jgi:glutamate-5-semialdehyde dehydrogenase
VLADLDRAGVRTLLKRHDQIDVVIPRGSPTLIDFCQLTSTMPVIASSGGVNHLYVDVSADLAQAAAIIVDSKLDEPTACNTVEMVLAHQEIAAALVRELVAAGRTFPFPWVVRVDPLLVNGELGDGAQFGRTGPDRLELSELGRHDLGREFLDRSLGVLAVPGLTAAAKHIRNYGSRHTEGIAAQDPEVIAQFLSQVDAAALIVNGSLRLHDGPSMGLGPELSISTGRLHVRGPVGLSALMTYTWVIDGAGAVRGIARSRT